MPSGHFVAWHHHVRIIEFRLNHGWIRHSFVPDAESPVDWVPGYMYEMYAPARCFPPLARELQLPLPEFSPSDKKKTLTIRRD